MTSSVGVGLEGSAGRVESNSQKSLSLRATVSFLPQDSWKPIVHFEFGTFDDLSGTCDFDRLVRGAGG